ncbi:unnamed protein product [Closterium sp. Naga37s-1]|nr:unnamed protein product [Closterium sp. Naga37s-1]
MEHNNNQIGTEESTAPALPTTTAPPSLVSAAAGNLQVAQSDHNAGDLDLSPDGGPVVDDSGDAGVPLVRSPAVTNPRDDPTSPRVHWTATEMLQLVQARFDLDPDWDLMRGVQGANYWAALHTLVLERHPRFRFSRGAIKIKMLRIEAQYKQLRDRLSRSGAGAIRYFPSWYGLMETIRGNRPGVQPVHRVTAAMITTPTPLPVPTPTAVTHVGPIRARPAVLASTTTTIPSVDATIRAATTGGSGRNTRTPSTDVNSPVTPSGPVSRTPTPRTPTTAVVTPVTTTNQPTAPPSGTGSPSTPSPSVPTASPSTSAGGTGTPPAGGSPTQSNGRSPLLLLAPLALALLMLLAEPASGFEADALPGWLGDTYRSTPEPKPAAAEPEPGLSEPRVVRLSWKPRAWIYKQFLTHEECDHIIALARPNMTRSEVVADNGTEEIDPIRTSYGTFLEAAQDDVIKRIEDRIATWTFLAPENQESMQVLRYAVGQKYDAHHDFFEEDEKQQQGGHRYATVLMYLTDGFHGGETVFPDSEKDKREKDDTWSDCGKQGVAAKPVKGDALLFFSLKPSAEPDLASLHAGCPVLAGEKWSATKWIHVRSFEEEEDGGEEGEKVSSQSHPPGACVDESEHCVPWAKAGECEKNPGYMHSSCARSCGKCSVLAA